MATTFSESRQGTTKEGIVNSNRGYNGDINYLTLVALRATAEDHKTN